VLGDFGEFYKLADSSFRRETKQIGYMLSEKHRNEMGKTFIRRAIVRSDPCLLEL
jgi:hypothetical protein